MKFAIALAVAALLSACTTSPPQIQTVTVTKIVTPDIPLTLLTCMKTPEVPLMTLQSQVARLLVQEYIAGQDCRLHLEAVSKALGH